MSTALFLGIGFVLLASLLFALMQRRSTERVSTDLLEGSKETASFFADIPPRELADRLFGPEDSQFVASEGSHQTKHAFLQQRRDLALAWMELLRRRTSRLMSLHREAARTSPQLEPLVELRLSVRYLAFLVFWQFLAFAIWVHGPVGLRSLTRSVDSLSAELLNTIETLFPEALDTLGERAISRLTK